jgi:glycosyltransferase involved in cell wall biosynthesis
MIIGGTFYGNANNEDDFVLTLKEKAKFLKDRIVFTGFVSYEKIPDYLQLADIAVLPSMWEEPFGLTVVEAMAAGLPLITTRSGGIPEICEGVATIVERDDIVNNLAQAILDLYEHPEKRKQMAAASLKRAKLFDKETYAKNFFEALEEL